MQVHSSDIYNPSRLCCSCKHATAICFHRSPDTIRACRGLNPPLCCLCFHWLIVTWRVWASSCLPGNAKLSKQAMARLVLAISLFSFAAMLFKIQFDDLWLLHACVWFWTAGCSVHYPAVSIRNALVQSNKSLLSSIHLVLPGKCLPRC